MKLFNKKNKVNNLDEYQELQLLKIEHNGCWIAFWGLLIAICVQTVIYGFTNPGPVIGEWIVFMVLDLYLLWDCKRHNIWDRRLKPNFKTNLIVSILAALAVCVVMTLVLYRNFPDALAGAFAGGVFFGVVVFVLCICALQFEARSYKKMLKKLEEEPEEEEEK